MRKCRLFKYLLLSMTIVIMTGCKNSKNITNEAVSQSPEATETISDETVVTEDTEVAAIDIAALEELEGIALTATERAHNIYHGRFGDEEGILSLWIDRETQEAQISFVGAYHSEKLSFACELQEEGIRYHDDKYYLLLRQQEGDILTGYFYEKGMDLKEVDLTLQAINYSQDKEHLYQIGSNEEVEAFAQKVLDAINGYDFEAFSNYVAFPVNVHVNQAVQLIETKEEFLELGEDVIFTDEFTTAMAVAYANIMFANGTDGVMLGDGNYNVWINQNTEGKLKVVGINN